MAKKVDRPHLTRGPKGLPVTYNGKEYASIKSLANAFGLNTAVFYSYRSKYDEKNVDFIMDKMLKAKARSQQPRKKLHLSREELHRRVHWREAALEDGDSY